MPNVCRSFKVAPSKARPTEYINEELSSLISVCVVLISLLSVKREVKTTSYFLHLCDDNAMSPLNPIRKNVLTISLMLFYSRRVVNYFSVIKQLYTY